MADDCTLEVRNNLKKNGRGLVLDLGPLPPPPDRPIYQHEKEGWYGWITETPTEPDPLPLDMRMKAHRLLWDALDYIVSLEADAFFPGFNNDGSGWPDFSSLVMGHRLYETASPRTYRPDSFCKVANRVRGEDGQFLYGGEDLCPKWMQHTEEGSLGKEGAKSEDDGLPDYESNDFVKNLSLIKWWQNQSDSTLGSR
ncbi:auxin-independent growth promoter-like protein [Sesbania bispinosa]|nr:auxin-independent growth promoter-like protein [Sesbania bispinosa]